MCTVRYAWKGIFYESTPKQSSGCGLLRQATSGAVCSNSRFPPVCCEKCLFLLGRKGKTEPDIPAAGAAGRRLAHMLGLMLRERFTRETALYALSPSSPFTYDSPAGILDV